MIRVNVSQLAAEFAIVVIGVAVALAADSWREDLADREVELEYIQRLLFDLESGKRQLEGQLNGQSNASKGAKGLLENLANGPDNVIDEEIVDNFINASKLGFNPSALSHRDTYDELISTGRLNIIQNKEILSALAEYYRAVDDIALIRDGNPRYLLELFGGLVGKPPYQPIVDHSSLTAEQQEEIVSEVVSSVELPFQLRLILSRHDLLIDKGRIQNAINLNEELRKLLSGSLS